MAACAGARHPSAGKRPSHEQRRQRGRNRAPGRAGRRTRQGGDPAPSRSTSSGSGRAAVARYRAGHRAAVVRGHPAPRRPGLGWAVPAYLALAFVCLVLAVIDAATGLLPNRSTYPAFPVAAGLLLAASLGLGELGRLGRGLLAAASVGGLFLPLALLSPHGMGVGGPLTALTLVGRRETRPPEGRDRHVDSARLRTGQGTAPMASGTSDFTVAPTPRCQVPMRGSGAMASRSARCRTTSPSCSPVTAAR